jgi:hypothetical protein
MRIKSKEHYKNSSGIIIPSVTTVLNILAKPALIRWANRLGLEGIDMDKYKDELADIGTLTHYLIMCRLREEIPETNEFTPEQLELAQGCFKKYIEWEGKNPIRPILVEERLVSEQYQYGGQPDLYALCINGGLMLADFKTNAKGIFPEMIYQVAAYRQLLLEAGYKVSKAVILRLGRTDLEGAEEKILSTDELDVGLKIFLHSLEIYRLQSSSRRWLGSQEGVL